MAITITEVINSGYTVDGDSVTVTPAGSDDSVISVGYARTGTATPAATISSATIGAQSMGVNEFDTFILGSQDAYTFGLNIPDADIPSGANTFDVEWWDGVDPVALLEDFIGVTLHLNGAEQTLPFRTQTGTDSEGFTTEALPNDLDYTGLTGDLVVYQVASSGSNTWNTPAGFTEQATSSTGGGAIDTLLGAGKVYTKILTSDDTAVSIPQPKTAVSNGWHFLKVVKAVSDTISLNPQVKDISIEAFKAFVLTSETAVLRGPIGSYNPVGSVAEFPHVSGNTSGGGYDPFNKRVGVIRNGAAIVYEYALNDYATTIRALTLLSTNGSDTEGWCYMPNGEAACCLEDGGQFLMSTFDVPTGSTDINLTSKANYVLRAPNASPDLNAGPEGIVWVEEDLAWYIVCEGNANVARRVLKVLRPGVGGRFGNTTTDYSYLDPVDGDGWSFAQNVSEPFDAEVAFASLGATGAQWDLSDIDYDPLTGNLVIVSETGAETAQVNRFTGEIVSTRALTGFTQIEMAIVLPAGEVMFGGEPREYQIYEFDPGLIVQPTVKDLTIESFNATVTVDSTLEVNPAVKDLTITSFNASIDISSSINLTPTVKDLTIQSFNALVTIGGDLELFPAVVDITVQSFNATVNTGELWNEIPKQSTTWTDEDQESTNWTDLT